MRKASPKRAARPARTAPQRRVGVHEAKTHLSELLRLVEKGGEVIVVRGGRPVARIVPAQAVTAPSESYGMFAGQFVVADDFDADADELGDLFAIPRGSSSSTRRH